MVQVSAIIPTYNRREWVQLAIDSVLAQRGVSLECIVVDDGSTDGTGDQLAQRYGDKIRYVYQINQGESSARNHGAQLASGQYLAFLDSDDIWLSGKLAAQQKYMEANPDYGAVYCRAYAVNELGRPILRLPYGSSVLPGHINLPTILTNGFALSGSTPMIRASAFALVGRFDTNIHYGEDVAIVIQMLLHGLKVGILRQPLVEVRSHTSSQSLTIQQDRFSESYRDHCLMLDSIPLQAQDPSVVQAVQSARQNEAMKMLAYAIYAADHEQAEEIRRSPHLPHPIPSQAYDRQNHYFTPLIYRENQDPRRVLDFIHALFAYRDTHSPGTGRLQQDTLEVLRAAVWCAGQDTRHNIFAWQQVFAALTGQPGLLLSFTFWKLIARMLFGRLYIQLYLLWSRRFHV